MTAEERLNAVETRLKSVEDEFKRYKIYAKVAGVIILALVGVGHFYEVPKVARKAADDAINQDAGKEVVAHLKDLKSQFDHLSDARSVARADLTDDLRHTFVSVNSPYLIVWDNKGNGGWNLDVNGAVEREGMPVDISGNGIAQWRIVEKRK